MIREECPASAGKEADMNSEGVTRVFSGFPVMESPAAGKGASCGASADPVDEYVPGGAGMELQSMTDDYKSSMTSYLNGVKWHVPDFFTQSGGLMDFYKGGKALLGHPVESLDGVVDGLEGKNGGDDVKDLDLSGGCQDLAAKTGDILKRHIDRSHYWNARNVRIGNPYSATSAFGMFQHNAVVVYPKGEKWESGFVFDPWKNESAGDPIPFTTWLDQYKTLSTLNSGVADPDLSFPVWVGAENDIGSESSGVYTQGP